MKKVNSAFSLLSRCFLTCCFFVVSYIQPIGCQPEKLLYTVANPARGLLEQGKDNNIKKCMMKVGLCIIFYGEIFFVFARQTKTAG